MLVPNALQGKLLCPNPRLIWLDIARGVEEPELSHLPLARRGLE